MTFWIIIGIIIGLIAIMVIFIVVSINRIIKKKKNNSYKKPKEGDIFWSDNWTLSGYKKNDVPYKPKRNSRMFVVRKVDNEDVTISTISKHRKQSQKGYKLTKVDYPKLDYNSVVDDMKTNKIICDPVIEKKSRKTYNNANKIDIKKDNKKLFSEYTFSLNKIDRKNLKSILSETKDREELIKYQEKRKQEKEKNKNKKREK